MCEPGNPTLRPTSRLLIVASLCLLPCCVYDGSGGRFGGPKSTVEDLKRAHGIDGGTPARLQPETQPERMFEAVEFTPGLTPRGLVFFAPADYELWVSASVTCLLDGLEGGLVFLDPVSLLKMSSPPLGRFLDAFGLAMRHDVYHLSIVATSPPQASAFTAVVARVHRPEGIEDAARAVAGLVGQGEPELTRLAETYVRADALDRRNRPHRIEVRLVPIAWPKSLSPSHPWDLKGRQATHAILIGYTPPSAVIDVSDLGRMPGMLAPMAFADAVAEFDAIRPGKDPRCGWGGARVGGPWVPSESIDDHPLRHARFLATRSQRPGQFVDTVLRLRFDQTPTDDVLAAWHAQAVRGIVKMLDQPVGGTIAPARGIPPGLFARVLESKLSRHLIIRRVGEEVEVALGGD